MAHFLLPVNFNGIICKFLLSGNHDYYYGNAEEWLDLLRTYDVRVLRNGNYDLNGICLVGVDDISAEMSGY